jgi:hypothetical protein
LIQPVIEKAYFIARLVFSHCDYHGFIKKSVAGVQSPSGKYNWLVVAVPTACLLTLIWI